MNDLPVDPSAEEPSSGGGCLRALGCFLLLGACVTLSVVGYAVRYPLFVALSDLDSQVEFVVEGDENQREGARAVLLRRGRAAGLPLRLERSGTDRLRVECRSADAEAVRGLLEESGKFRLMLVADEAPDRAKEIAASLAAAAASGSEEPLASDYALVPWDPSSREATAEPLLLVRAGRLEGSDVRSFGKASGPNGGGAIQFTMTSEGAKRLGALTEANVGRRLAIVLNDRVVSAPTIRSRIGKSGIIDVQGRRDAQLEELIRTLQLASSPAPCACSRIEGASASTARAGASDCRS